MNRVFNRRVRGFRLVDVVSLGCLIALVLGVYLAKTFAGRERQEIARLERQIRAEQASIRLLTAEVAHLEQPERLERLAEGYLGLKPVEVEREAEADALASISRGESEGEAEAAVPASSPVAVPGTTVSAALAGPAVPAVAVTPAPEAAPAADPVAAAPAGEDGAQ